MTASKPTVDLRTLATEQRNSASELLDTLTPEQIARIINDADTVGRRPDEGIDLVELPAHVAIAQGGAIL